MFGVIPFSENENESERFWFARKGPQTPPWNGSGQGAAASRSPAYYDDAGGGFAPSSVNGGCRSRIQDQVAVAGAVAGLTKIFLNHIQKDFLINVLV